MTRDSSTENGNALWRCRRAALVLICIVLSLSAAGQKPALSKRPPPGQLPTIDLPFCSTPPKIDGILDDACWRVARQVSAFVQQQPKPDGEPSGHIVTYLAYDRRHLYVAATIEEKPSDVRAYITKRDDVFSSDVFVLGLDPTKTHQQIVMFWVTAGGIQGDSVMTPQNGNPDFSWDTIWLSAARRTPQGYAVEMAIPFRSLRYDGTGRQTWNFALFRLMPKNSELDSYPPISASDFQSNLFGYLAHMRLNVMSTPRELAIIPYGTGRFLARPGVPNSYGGRGGADFIYSPTSKITLNATVIPDFSEVEADQPQVDINLNHPLYFPEKRPFFTSGVNVFGTAASNFGPNSIFYSRKIVNPRDGLKATGELGSWQFGALLAQDHAQPGLSGAEDANDGVFRIKRPFGASNFFGFNSTLKASPQAHNQLLGPDWELHISKRWDWQGAAFATSTHGQNETAQAVSNIGPDSVHPDTIRSSGYSASTVVSYNTDVTGFFANASAVSPNYDPQLGFEQQTDIKSLSVFGNRLWPINKHQIEGIRVFGGVNRNWTYDYGLAEQAEHAGIGVPISGQTFIGYQSNIARDQWNHHFFSYHTNDIFGQTRYLKWFRISIDRSWGPAINYSDSYLGYSRSTNFDIGSDISRFHTDLQGQDYRFYAATSGPQRLSSLVWFWRTEYYLDRRTYLRNILLGSSSDKTLEESVLLRRIVAPGTEFYIGFGSDYLRTYGNTAVFEREPDFAMVPLTGPTLNPVQRHFLLKERGLFFKFSKRFDF